MPSGDGMDQLKSQVHLLICLPVPLHQGGQVTTRYGPEAQERRNGVGAGGGYFPEGSIFFFFFSHGESLYRKQYSQTSTCLKMGQRGILIKN